MNMSGRQVGESLESSWMNFLERLNNHLQMVNRVVTKVHPKCHRAYTCDSIENVFNHYMPNNMPLNLFSHGYNK